MKEDIMQYQASMSMFKNWFDNGVISLDDLRVIDTKMTEKYGISSSSIFRPQTLLLSPKRVINVMPKGGESSHDDKKSETAD